MQNISRDCHRRVLPGNRHSGRTLYAKAQSEPYAREENITQRAYLPLKRSSPRPQFYRWKGGSGAWTRTRISSSKGWRATDCTTPDQVMASSLLVYLRPATGQQCPPGHQQLRCVFLPSLAANMWLSES